MAVDNITRLLRQLEMQARAVNRRIDRQIQKMRRVAGVGNVPEAIIREAEKQINQEGWMERIMETRFLQGRTSLGGTKWVPLSPKYAERKKGPRILVESGDMESAAVAAVAGTFRYRMSDIYWDVALISEIPYAEYHQYGMGNNPERRFFDKPTFKEMAPILAAFRSKVQVLMEARLQGTA